MIVRLASALGAASLTLAGCAAAPRAPAATLAAAGISATATVGAQVQEVADQLRAAPAIVALTRTLKQCTLNTRLACLPVLESPEVVAEREKLANVVALRGRALKALGAAYAALQTEAAYDQKADLTDAAGEAVKAADSFAGAAARLGGNAGAAPTVPQPVASLASFGFGVLGEHLQRQRILKASRQIAVATLQIRNGMVGESAAFHRIMQDVARDRADARLQLMDSGLVSRLDVMQQLADQLKVKLVPNFATVIAASTPDQVALKAASRSLADQEVAAAGSRYDQAIAALGALLTSHAQLEAGKPMSIGDVQRFLAALDASLATNKPAPPPAAPTE